MTDSIEVFDPGWRLLDQNGVPISGGTISFFLAGTTTPLVVYATSDLATTPLGSVVYTDSEGKPVSGQMSSTAVLVYTGAAAYKIIFKDASGNTLFGGAFDTIKGALDTSNFLLSGSTSTLAINVISKTANYTIVAGDRSKLINADPTGGTFTLTLTAAATLANNWSVKIRNNGTAGQVMIATSDLLHFEGQTFTQRALDIGEAMEIVCDGVGFHVVNYTPPLMASKGPALITVVDFVSSAPGGPTPGKRWIVSGAFSTFSIGDIIEANGVGFNRYTPPANSGWLAYSQAASALYRHTSAGWLQTSPSPLPTTQRLAGSGTYTPAANVTKVRVRMCGGGGGGGAQATNAGQNGGDTSFGSWTALHGAGGTQGGAAATPGGAGGTGGANGTGNVIARMNGGAGSPGFDNGSSNIVAAGAQGGSNPFAGAGTGGINNAAGNAAQANTGGGGGGASNANTTNSSGAGGGAGEYVEFWVANPGNTSYAVGAGGAGGAAGSFKGGDGAAGTIIVEEYYN